MYEKYFGCNDTHFALMHIWFCFHKAIISMPHTCIKYADTHSNCRQKCKFSTDEKCFLWNLSIIHVQMSMAKEKKTDYKSICPLSTRHRFDHWKIGVVTLSLFLAASKNFHRSAARCMLCARSISKG